MPLVALNKSTGERIDITVFGDTLRGNTDPRKKIRSTEIMCQECGEGMILRAGLIKAAHFAHKPGSNCTYGNGESVYHLAAKKYIAEFLRTQGEKEFNARVELEWKIGNRRAAVVQIFEAGWAVAHEIQLASITTEELEERTQDYLRNGCDVIWYLGKSANTQANRQWVKNNQYSILEIMFN